MSNNQSQETQKHRYVQQMFEDIAGTYDLLNRIISMGQDARWRRRLVDLLNPVPNQMYLDIGAGTGDLSQTIINRQPEAVVTAADFSFQMISVGKHKNHSPNVLWLVADAQALPFSAQIFHGAVSGYLLRNVPDIEKTLLEQYRVLMPGSIATALDTTPPEKNWYDPLIRIYLFVVIPLVGLVISGNRHAYRYLPNSTIHHIPADKLKKIFTHCGFSTVAYLKLMFGTMAIHSGRKPLIDAEE
jgi:demethylmenaquinone methyltransferase/2-methoxy-6-polyprenyl-1,4-benzoquinol methylase